MTVVIEMCDIKIQKRSIFVIFSKLMIKMVARAILTLIFQTIFPSLINKVYIFRKRKLWPLRLL